MPAPRFAAVRTTLQQIQPLRALFLRETNVQIRYDACHARGWTDSWLLTRDDQPVGYGSVKGDDPAARDTVFEFYAAPPVRRRASALFATLLAACGADRVECQSNDLLLSALLFEFARDVNADTILFEHAETTRHALPGATFRPRRPREPVFEHADEPVGEYVVEVDGEVAATGGYYLHYNPPFADVYMEVAPAHRRRGVGTFLVQEVARECWLAGRVPAARTGLGNVASRQTLTKAGMRVSGFMLAGRIPRTAPAPGESR
jgi:GNAT superfamily N-acetyltransferase